MPEKEVNSSPENSYSFVLLFGGQAAPTVLVSSSQNQGITRKVFNSKVRCWRPRGVCREIN